MFVEKDAEHEIHQKALSKEQGRLSKVTVVLKEVISGESRGYYVPSGERGTGHKRAKTRGAGRGRAEK